MLVVGLLLSFSFIPSICASKLQNALNCSNPAAKDVEACEQRVHDVVALFPGSSYVANIESKASPYEDLADSGNGVFKNHRILFLNLTVSRDRRAILLNDLPIHPLQTIPKPPSFKAVQFPTTFSNTNLSSGIQCPEPNCNGPHDLCSDWCQNLPLESILLDYLYIQKLIDYQGPGRDPDSTYWEISLDIIGGRGIDPRRKFNDASQKMLRILVAGKQIIASHRKGRTETKTTSDLFGSWGEDKEYEYAIINVTLEERLYTFPTRRPLSVWGKLRRFFGNDVWANNGTRFLFLKDEWGYYGKQGTLRNIFGEFAHSRHWSVIWAVLGSAIGGLVVLCGVYRLYFWIMRQRELANWDGIHDVWDRLRAEPEEENTFLDGGYRDDPDEGSSSRLPRYTDEVLTTKPLPSKPLPEKPLPAVPLIDA